VGKDAVRSFFAKFVQDKQLQERFRGVTSEGAAVALAVELGGKHGFSFGEEDVRAFLSEFHVASGSELSDSQLGAVAGGFAVGKPSYAQKADFLQDPGLLRGPGSLT
jgi:predicted ribosomally synthesized peptide with nif11-like leader